MHDDDAGGGGVGGIVIAFSAYREVLLKFMVHVQPLVKYISARARTHTHTNKETKTKSIIITKEHQFRLSLSWRKSERVHASIGR